MNKQELIKKYEKKFETIYGFPVIRLSLILEDLKQLDEPHKVTVPQFVAEYIEFKKKYDFHVYGAMREIEDYYDKRVQEWFYENNIETFVRAWLDGYEVEKEKKYKVKFKNIQSGTRYLKYDGVIEKWYFGINQDSNTARLCHTKEELEEAGFDWVFDCKGMEVEEVAE